jgi:hypothetical protein
MRRGRLRAAGVGLAVSLLAGCASGGGVPTWTTAYPPREVGDKALPISLIDQTGLVMAIAAAPDASTSSEVEPVPDRPSELRVSWVGGACDDRVTMVLVDIGATYQLAIHNHPQFAAGITCDASGIPRIVDITFNRPLEPADLSITVQFP